MPARVARTCGGVVVVGVSPGVAGVFYLRVVVSDPGLVSFGEVRPVLSSDLSGEELQRWYWMKAELVGLARVLGVSTGGGKVALTERIVAALDGRVAEHRPTARKARSSRLPEPLTRDTVVGPRQASTQQLRTFLEREIGKRFSFDAHMRDFLASDTDKTLGQVVDHWHASRHAPRPETPPQLELIRFTKAWHVAHPAGTAEQCRAAWKEYRGLPTDKRIDPGESSPAAAGRANDGSSV
jgi:SAP domain-containing new25/Domain of unknown function (DUF6434)